MQPFRVGVGIRQYRDVKSFAEEFVLSEEDLIVTNQYIYEPVISSLGLPCQVLFQEKYGSGEPTDDMVNAILDTVRGMKKVSRIIAVGGGTVIDIAKVMAVAGPEDYMDDLYDRAPDLEKAHGLVIIPTTCGTGSEMTNISIVSRVSRQVKQGLVSPAMFADEAVLITELLATLPYPVFATSSIDAMIHAVESYLSPNACPMSELFSEKALQMILRGWMDSVGVTSGDQLAENAAGQDAEIDKERWKMHAADFLLASNYAGIAFGYAGCAAVHALSYPVGSVHHVPHGQSNQLLFADVMRKYQEKKPVGKLNQLEEILGKIFGVDPVFSMSRLYRLLDMVYAKDRLRDHGVTEDELPVYAENVLKTQQRLLKNNYTELTCEDILEIYQKAF